MKGHEMFSANCACSQSNHEPKLIALTGGPGAGKTAVLELAKKHFCEHIAILPEAAGILFGGGFWRGESDTSKKAAQRAIFHVQRELERMVQEEKWAVVALCDRGTLDGLAYWPGSKASFFEENATDLQKEFSRYAAVLHIRTPALAQGYNHDNPIRVETAKEAARIDERIADAWARHPNRHFIENRTEFVVKAMQAMDLIRAQLPSCCQGFERKRTVP